MSSGVSAPNPASIAPIAAVVPLVGAWRLDHAFDYLVPADLVERVQLGSLVRVPLAGRRVRGIVTALKTETPERRLEPVAGVVLDEPVAPPPQLQLLEWLARRYVTPRGIAYARAVPPRVRIAGVDVSPLAGLAGTAPPGLMNAYEGGSGLLGALADGGGGDWCLRPLATHSRGALIAELVAACGRSGRSALVAVPEVRYGSEVLDALAREFPGLVRLDSTRSEAERARSWLAMARGNGLGAGGRAALLTPAPGLGLIVVDEEHHPSYHEDQRPRYDARRLALQRAELTGACCVFVSSTPSVDLGGRPGDRSLRLLAPARADERAARPIVEILETPVDRALATALHERMRDVLAGGGKVALLAPRRGYARVLWCASCRRSLRCAACEGALAVDRRAGRLRCARCGADYAPPDVCPTCGSDAWRQVGSGVERLAEQVALSFPRARVTWASPEHFDSGEIAADTDIYVTTWIGTKPTVRPDVDLVGVLDADALIRRSNFRSAEFAVQALFALAEWAGPAAKGGRLMIQSTDARHYVLQAVVRADYNFFLERELEARKELSYPPYTELIRLRAHGGDAAQLLAGAAAVARAKGGRVLGPIIRKTAAGEELQALVKCPSADEVAEALRDILASARPQSGLFVDVDPR